MNATRSELKPFCNICGWRKGGIDSWNGVACKCGYSDAPMTADTNIPPMLPTETENVLSTLRAENKRLREALESAVYSLAWHEKQGHFVAMDAKHLRDARAALAGKD